jgi:hypothetical protein
MSRFARPTKRAMNQNGNRNREFGERGPAGDSRSRPQHFRRGLGIRLPVPATIRVQLPLCLKTDGSGYGQRQAKNGGRGPPSRVSQQGGFVNGSIPSPRRRWMAFLIKGSRRQLAGGGIRPAEQGGEQPNLGIGHRLMAVRRCHPHTSYPLLT